MTAPAAHDIAPDTAPNNEPHANQGTKASAAPSAEKAR